MKHCIHLRIVLCLLVLFTLALSVVVAQETTAGLQGIVKDQTGAVVSNATVELSGASLLGVKKATTDAAGFYRFSSLPSGTYTLTVSAKGFKVAKRSGIELAVGRLPNLDIQLDIGQATEVMEVTEFAPIVDVTQSKVAVTVSRDELDNMPKGRSFQTLIPFAAGARQEPLQSARGQRNSGYQIDGASDGENVYLIDGVNTTDVNVGGIGKSFQTDFIQEVQIKSSSFEAEYGGALGGVINAVAKRGSNAWHGEFKTYLELSGLNANDNCASGFTNQTDIPGFTISNDATHRVCGQRLDPNGAVPSANTGTRQDGTPEYYVYKKDDRRIITPGYEVGGPLFSNKLWLFSSYIPQIDTTHRTTTFTGPNPGPRTLTRSMVQHNMYNRLDYGLLNSLRLFASWNYAYTRVTGQLGTSDSPYGQVNTGASTDPNSFRSDAGTVNPLAVYSFGGDWTPNTKTVITARYGYFFSNTESRGVPSGTRYIYDTTVSASTLDLTKQPFTSAFNTSGFSNIPPNFSTQFDAFKRKSFSVDGSYFVGHAFGSHTFKAGYFWTAQNNGVLITANGNVVDLFWGTAYTPLTSTTACDAIIAQNITAFGSSGNFCGGRYGYFFTGSQQTSNTGTTSQTAHALYFQDAWTVGHGLTLNLGIRFDKETLPPYDPKRFPTVSFGWGDKIAPRIGGAYDLFRNGKVKIYASYGKFFDIMKMNLARGSFGSDYWHECVYALDTTNYSSIQPTLNTGAGCPPSGAAPGLDSFRFIENVDFRATKADPRDPAIDPHMKPMAQHEFVTGVDWAITPSWGLESRYSRKRLDNAIEDMAITDNLGFYIGNPGTPYADVLHRPVVIPDASGNNYLTTVPFCAECPGVVRAIRRYDGAEFRLTHRTTKNWYGFVSYTYSKLTGNYPGLTNSDPTDGNGGRHNPNNTRLFDIPTMTYLPNGKIDDGPLSTDRPHSAKVAGYYRLKWFGMETGLGLIQSAFQGTPINTCLPVVGTSSACQWAEGRDGWAHFTRTAGDFQGDPTKPNYCPTCGDFVLSGVSHNARTDPFFQTDLTLRHEIGLSKSHENYKLIFEANVYNLLNQRAVEAVNENVNGSGGQLVSPTRASRFSGDPQVDWGALMNGYNYLDAVNLEGAFAGNRATQTPMTLASRYGLPTVFQTARQFRLAVRFKF
jgi:hypothetical protein